MSGWMAVGLLSSLFGAVPTNVEWQYAGTLQRAQQGTEGNTTSKKFSLAVVAWKTEGDQALAYLTDDRGDGAWAWPERFGVLALPGNATNVAKIRHRFDGNDYAIPLRRPVFEFPERLNPATEAEWTEGRDRYVREGGKQIAGRDCTLIEATLDRGLRQTLAIETSTGLLVQLQERLFLGRGDAFELTLQLEDVRALDAGEAKSAQATMEALMALQSGLNRTGENRPADLSREQTQLTSAALPELKKSSTGTMWARFIETIERDLSQQARRLDGVAGLAQKYVGQPASFPSLKLISGDLLKAEDFKGHTTVLHFWEYNGEKLVEPYGQVGYLDFLHNRRAKLGAKIVGVAVDPRVGNAGTATAAVRSVRKLQEFMNLSFPITTDDGKFLATLGDPRLLGSTLPLWVVIGHDGVITHYHVGTYDIQPDEGLKQLDAAVVAALKKQLEARRDQ